MSGIRYESGNPQSLRDSSFKKEPGEKTPEELLREWQERLGLQGWRIKLKAGVREKDMPVNDASGHVRYVESTRAALIHLLAEVDYDPDLILAFDTEESLVHELLHLKFCLLDGERFHESENLQDRLVHQLIDDLSRALICAKRGILRIGIKQEGAEP